MARKLRSPLPRPPNMFGAGTRQSAKVMPWVSLACHPSFRYAGSIVIPGVPAGTTNDEISPGPVSAVTVTTDVIGVPELVMNALLPSSTHSSVVVSYVARVRVPPASLPASGSVRPNAPRRRPATRSGSHSARCSSVPKE